ncbi:MAG TPA: 50S ribosomal protein L11 methyltransferase [Xanthobacteraceae bacterium]
MISAPSRAVDETTVAWLESGEQTARRLVDLIAEDFGADDAAVGLVDIGHGNFRVTAHFRDAPDGDALRALIKAAAGPAAAAALTFERIAAKDWVGESLAGLEPVAAGRFIVHGAHDRARVAVNRIGIEIEAALAFGTGHHGTTRGCLLALDRLSKSLNVRRRPQLQARGALLRMPASRGQIYRILPNQLSTSATTDQAAIVRGPRRLSPGRPKAGPIGGRSRVTGQRLFRILDLGTGSGVLAIAAARALRQRVLATDVDPTAVHVARANARLNRVGALVEVVEANGIIAERLRSHAPFDIIFANVLLGPLQRLATPLIKLTAPGGRIVLSGLLSSQANAARAAYHALALERRIVLDGWTTLILKRCISA